MSTTAIIGLVIVVVVPLLFFAFSMAAVAGQADKDMGLK